MIRNSRRILMTKLTLIHASMLTVVVLWMVSRTCTIFPFDEQAFIQPPMAELHSPLLQKNRLSAQPFQNKMKDESGLFDIDMTNYSGPARAFPRWNQPFPCFPIPKQLMRNTPSKRGILFQRPHKTGSTTMSGITMRIAQRRAQIMLQQQHHQQRQNQSSVDVWCDHRANHGSGVQYQYALRNRNQSFLFSIIRNPTRRGISDFFHFGVAAYRNDPTDENFRKHLLKSVRRNQLLHDLSVHPIINDTTNNTTVNYAHAVQSVLQNYDFIALLERFDESLVVLKMLLDLDFEDILYVKDRSEGTFTNGYNDRPCIYILPR